MQDQPAAGFDVPARQLLLALARDAVRYAVRCAEVFPVALERVPAALRAPGASFVSLHRHGALRGCVGSILACRPLAEDVAHNAFAAALHDRRFERLRDQELDGLDVSLHVLSPLEPLPFVDLADLHARLRPAVDGLMLELGARRALFLPVMWETLPTPPAYVAQLLRKACIAPHEDLSGLRASRFSAQVIEQNR